jgi:hypothetical protein
MIHAWLLMATICKHSYCQSQSVARYETSLADCQSGVRFARAYPITDHGVVQKRVWCVAERRSAAPGASK